MRLITIDSHDTLKFVEYQDDRQTPRYGILSHRWQDEEVAYQDMLSGASTSMKGFSKIRAVFRQCAADGLSHVWVDTCCINKDSSAELSEAINSMYKWYQNAAKCYVFLYDVEQISRIAKSEWFERGWTLQELIAPNDVQFFNNTWEVLGSKAEHRELIGGVTGIPQDVLYGESPLNYSIAQRMSWAARRKTTRIEDQAYSLMGLFNVNMPMLYGEGEKAFTRLQEEIIKYSADQSIFAWPGIISEYDKSELYDVTLGRLEGLFATSPAAFQQCGNIASRHDDNDQRSFSVTNVGLSLELLLRPVSLEIYEANLNCSIGSQSMSIFLRQTDQDGQYVRCTLHGSLNGTWTFSKENREERVRVNIVQGLKLDTGQVCEPEIILLPGPLSQAWSNGSPSPYFKPRKEGILEKSKIDVPNGAYDGVTELAIKGGLNGAESIYLETGFDLQFNPTLWILATHRRITGNSVSVLHTAPRTSTVQVSEIGDRHAVVRNDRPTSDDRWLFKGHRSKGLFIWLVGLNTVIDIRKKAILSRNFWTIDVQKADPRNSHLLSCAKGLVKQDKLLNSFDVSRERLTDDAKCPICLKFLAVAVATTCHHMFCQSCFIWANVSVKSATLSTFKTEKSGDEDAITTSILCPICGETSGSYIDLRHQYKIQNQYPHNWRYASWKSSEIDAPPKFPVFEFLTLTIGNTHKLTEEPKTSRQGHSNRHDWTFYVRPSHPELIADVRVILHKTFSHNVIDILNPPFEIRRFSWGTFTVTVHITLKSQYFFLEDNATIENGRRSKLRVEWKLSLWAHGEEGWLKVAVGRTKSRNTEYDLALLTQYGNVVALQNANATHNGHKKQQSFPVDTRKSAQATTQTDEFEGYQKQ